MELLVSIPDLIKGMTAEERGYAITALLVNTPAEELAQSFQTPQRQEFLRKLNVAVFGKGGPPQTCAEDCEHWDATLCMSSARIEAQAPEALPVDCLYFQEAGFPRV